MAEETKAAVAVEKPAEAEKTADGKPEGWDQVELPPPVQNPPEANTVRPETVVAQNSTPDPLPTKPETGMPQNPPPPVSNQPAPNASSIPQPAVNPEAPTIPHSG